MSQTPNNNDLTPEDVEELYEVNTDEVLRNVLKNQNANVLNPGKLNRNRSKKIRSPFLHNLPAVKGKNSIKPVPRMTLMKLGIASQEKRNEAAAAAETLKKMREAYLKSANESPENLSTPLIKNITKKGGRKTRRVRRPSKASRKI
jgi:hypothetical protein